MRTFVALSFSVGTTRRIAEAMEREAARLAEGAWKLAWVPPAKLHLTLKFLGSIPNESLDAISLRLRQRCSDLAPIALRPKGYGAFPEAPDAPRVLWIGVDLSTQGGKQLLALRESVESDLEDLGFPREPRAFHPHLTIARVIEPPPSPTLWPGNAELLPASEEPIAELVVYESVHDAKVTKSHRGGAEYLARARVPFSKTR